MIYNLHMSETKESLEKRLKLFCFEIVKLTRSLPKTEENKIFGRQIIRSASSIGANYAEAVYGQTRQEFLHCMSISRKETNETLYWLEMILFVNPGYNIKINPLLEENKQILKIFISSIKTIHKNNSK
ncbi:MAG: hypothetical protein ACD_37C00045G0001 [uncultured bacterium]|nr:MAG: hypothetical protein ACD_37C00045G0001 [uncultured bacterium]